MSEIKRMKVSDLKPHPKNTEIYGQNEDISDLIEKIKRSGQIHTLVATSQGIVLAGHRRMKACKELGIDEVDVEIKDFETPEQEVEFIIDNNATREKTKEQRAREAIALKEIESLLAKKRQGKRNDLTSAQFCAEVTPKKKATRTSDVLAEKLDFKSGRDVERAINTVNAMDKLQEEGRTEEADLIRGVLNNGSTSAAENLAKNIDVVDIPEVEKEAIKSGKKSPNAYIKEANDRQKGKETDSVCTEKGTEEIIKNESKSDSDSNENYLIDIQEAVAQSSKTMTDCLEKLLPKQYLKLNKREVTDKIQSKLRSYLETINSIQTLISSMELKESELINLRETED